MHTNVKAPASFLIKLTAESRLYNNSWHEVWLNALPIFYGLENARRILSNSALQHCTQLLYSILFCTEFCKVNNTLNLFKVNVRFLQLLSKFNSEIKNLLELTYYQYA